MSQMKFRTFKACFKSWQAVFQEAADFATQMGRERVVSISHSEDSGNGVVTVWYWSA